MTSSLSDASLYYMFTFHSNKLFVIIFSCNLRLKVHLVRIFIYVNNSQTGRKRLLFVQKLRKDLKVFGYSERNSRR